MGRTEIKQEDKGKKLFVCNPVSRENALQGYLVGNMPCPRVKNPPCSCSVKSQSIKIFFEAKLMIHSTLESISSDISVDITFFHPFAFQQSLRNRLAQIDKTREQKTPAGIATMETTMRNTGCILCPQLFFLSNPMRNIWGYKRRYFGPILIRVKNRNNKECHSLNLVC